MFKTDGTPHVNGIKTEWSLIKFLNDPNNFEDLRKVFLNKYNKDIFYSFNFQHKGGTGNRCDLYDANNKIKLSIKSKKRKSNIYQGTFDLINTSKIFVYTNFQNFAFNKAYGKYEDFLISAVNNNLSQNEIKLGVNECIVNMINSLNANTINNIFKKIIELEHDVIDVVRDYNTNTNEIITLDKLHFLDKGWIQKESSNILFDKNTKINKKSFRIMNSNNEQTPFRLRVTLNNGIRALMVSLGLNPKITGKNSTSSMVFKIQVDDVKYIVEKYGKTK
ncbi:hypothetical protein [Mycoplasma seminis]|uniref:Uncharacterized protein n=1 Tax=Mycoplasma seminis TaxID=512749 RepID=A0ABY9HAD1_9MOLU|nr:hypothetical protein [Mycoplasma seminis]WLP85562.1 hypothetical protein Q8852_00070 [Mycoplasma seminis]